MLREQPPFVCGRWLNFNFRLYFRASTMHLEAKVWNSFMRKHLVCRSTAIPDSASTWSESTEHNTFITFSRKRPQEFPSVVKACAITGKTSLLPCLLKQRRLFSFYCHSYLKSAILVLVLHFTIICFPFQCTRLRFS